MHNGNGKTELAELTVAPAIAAGSALGVQSGVMPFSTREAVKPADNLQAIIKLLLSELGVDVDSQHFRDTPACVARFFREYTRGYRLHPEEILKTFNSRNKGLIVVSDIEFSFALSPPSAGVRRQSAVRVHPGWPNRGHLEDPAAHARPGGAHGRSRGSGCGHC